MQRSIPCTVMRGGTSKGLYLLEADIPPAGAERDKLLLRLMGSPDVKQIDGLGGATSVTSKVAILAKSERDGVDVDYTFAQVSVDKPVVSYAGNCGNISSGVGPFAIESGLVKAQPQETEVRFFNTNTKKLMIAHVQTPGGVVTYEGDTEIPGVPGTAAPVRVTVSNPAGSVCDALLPTGNVIDTLNIPDLGQLEVSIVDAANPLVFVRAKDIGFTGAELPNDIDGDSKRLELLERIRGEAALLLGFITDVRESALKSPGVPKMTIVSPPASYVSTSGKKIECGQIDVLGRMMSMQKAHATYALTGAMCTAAAAAIPGTIVNEAMSASADSEHLRIGHPGGVMVAGAKYQKNGDEITILEAYGLRTARMLLRGTAYY